MINAIAWESFVQKLKQLNKRIWINFKQPIPHPEYPALTLLGIHFQRKHVCSVTFDEGVPLFDVIDENGILTHQGLQGILQKLLKVEWVPEKSIYVPKEYQGHHFKSGVTVSDVVRVFGNKSEIWAVKN